MHDGIHLPAGRPQSRVLDQFYTRPDVARHCVERLLSVTGRREGDFFIDPAAGSGAFLDALPNPRIGLDIAPARDDIECVDFLRWWPQISASRIFVVSNFPFGKNATLAVKFINHSAAFADVVASILPRTFEKDTIKRRVDTSIELVDQVALPPNSFLYRGKPYSVPVVFQIWRRGLTPRILASRLTAHPDFTFLRSPEAADFAFQRVGVHAGKVSTHGLSRSAQSHYFIAARNQRREVFNILASINWTETKNRTAGNPSIGKAEIVDAYTQCIESGADYTGTSKT